MVIGQTVAAASRASRDMERTSMTDGPSRPHFGIAALALVMLANILFALNVIAMKVVVDASAPLLSVALRMGCVCLLCAPALRPSPGRTGWLMLYGFLNGGLFLLLLNLALFMATNVGALAIAGQLSVPFSLLRARCCWAKGLTGARSRACCSLLPGSWPWCSIRISAEKSLPCW